MKQHTITLVILSLILMSTVSGKRVWPSSSGCALPAPATTAALKGNAKVGGWKVQAGEIIPDIGNKITTA